MRRVATRNEPRSTFDGVAAVSPRLSFPTSLAFDGDGVLHVAESGLPFDRARAGGRILRLGARGIEVLADGLGQPVNGLTWHDGAFFVSEGGCPGRILRVSPEGEVTVVLDGLPGLGNYHTNMCAVGPDGRLYFGQGAMTNLGVIGLDSRELAWLGRLPQGVDVPGMDIVLRGASFATDDPLAADAAASALTGAFRPFAEAGSPGERQRGRLPCTAAVMRCETDGSNLELVAWGVRNAYGLHFLPDGRLLATDQGADDRGSRPVGNAPDLLIEVRAGAWYGWPDFIGDRPVTDRRFRPTRGAHPEFVLANHDELPPPEKPLMEFPVNAAATRLASSERHPGVLFVALFGDEKPLTAPAGARVGRGVGRIEMRDWSLHPTARGPWHRPIDVAFHPVSGHLLVLDFGEFEMGAGGALEARAGSGRVWAVDPELIGE